MGFRRILRVIAVAVGGNEASRNRGPGIVLEKDLNASGYANNKLSGNIPHQSLCNADFSGAEANLGPPGQ